MFIHPFYQSIYPFIPPCSFIQFAFGGINKKRGGTVRKVNPVPKEGFLMKKARDKKFLGPDWQKRFFQLEMGQLHFSEGKGTKNKLSDTITVQGLKITINAKDPLIIEIDSSPPLLLKASNETEARLWYQSLLEHGKYL